jgi:hypothetical protein
MAAPVRRQAWPSPPSVSIEELVHVKRLSSLEPGIDHPPELMGQDRQGLGRAVRGGELIQGSLSGRVLAQKED